MRTIRFFVWRKLLTLANKIWREDKCEFCGEDMFPQDGYHPGDGYECWTEDCPNEFYTYS